MAQIVKKITVAKCSQGNLKKMAAGMEDGQTATVLRVYGRVTGREHGQTDLGPYVKFRGQFRAESVHPDTGEVKEYSSAACILPEIAQDAIVGAMGEETSSLDFAFDVQITADESSVVGYTFGIVPLVEEAESDPLAALAAKLKDAPALTGPAENGDAAPSKGKSRGKAS